MVNTKNLELIKEIVDEKHYLTKREDINYFIPSIWLSYKKIKSQKLVKINPYKYFLDSINYILQSKSEKISETKHGEWSRSAVIYNLFVRTGCAFNHSQNGKLDLPVNSDGFRETGTFLKAICYLPYIKSLGINTVHLLPITSIGTDGNKGTLGSPYAIKNPYEIDPNLAEPAIGVGPEIEFKAFVEAAHKLGIRVVLEFVFRTMAKDGDWIKDHPEWFYWIKENIEDREPGSVDETKYGTPVFSHDELKQIFYSVGNNVFDGLIPPHEPYKNMFTVPPKKDSIYHLDGRYIGILENGQRVRIPGAFADWPPNDSQPPWGDVTYLKLYDHPDFNYISYNTIRMYDNALAQPDNANKPLWEKIIGIIQHYQRSFGINGVMIDMGHALPRELKQKMIHKARELDHDFAFWDENFSVTSKSVEEGYNAVIGYCWVDQHDPVKMKKIIHKFSDDGFPLSFFATPESHNTPRAAARFSDIAYSKYALVINSLIPAIPFMHNGFEIGEKHPINTGLGFTHEELQIFPSHALPLFSHYAFDWCNRNEFILFIQKIFKFRKKHQKLITDTNPKTTVYYHAPNPDLIIFERRKNKRLFCIANGGSVNSHQAEIDLNTKKLTATNLINDESIALSKGKLIYNIKPFECMLFEL